MNKVNGSNPQLCSALTLAGQPCSHLALRDSDPPMCDLHGLNWRKEPQQTDESDYYGRYLRNREKKATLSQMEQHSLTRELVVIRVLVAQMLDELLHAQAGIAEFKAFVPLILRSVKLLADLNKQVDSADGDGMWDEVLDRLNAELGIDV